MDEWRVNQANQCSGADGYVVCFSGQPELRYGKWWYDTPNYIDCMIPLVKEGQKVDISSNSSYIKCEMEEENGKEVIRVYHNTIPLTGRGGL